MDPFPYANVPDREGRPGGYMSAHGGLPPDGDYALPTDATRPPRQAPASIAPPPAGRGVKTVPPPVARPAAAAAAAVPAAAAAAPALPPTLDPAFATGIFVLYLLIGSNFLAKLLGCRIQTLLATHMFASHTLGFATLLFFVTLSGPGKALSFAAASAVSAGLYAWFMATTRMTAGTWAAMIGCLAAAYVVRAYVEATYRTPEERAAAVPAALDKVQAGLVAAAAAVTAVGVLIYMGEKRLEYAEDFSPLVFILGKPACRHASPAVPVGEALRAAFGLSRAD